MQKTLFIIDTNDYLNEFTFINIKLNDFNIDKLKDFIVKDNDKDNVIYMDFGYLFGSMLKTSSFYQAINDNVISLFFKNSNEYNNYDKYVFVSANPLSFYEPINYLMYKDMNSLNDKFHFYVNKKIGITKRNIDDTDLGKMITETTIFDKDDNTFKEWLNVLMEWYNYNNGKYNPYFNYIDIDKEVNLYLYNTETTMKLFQKHLLKEPLIINRILNYKNDNFINFPVGNIESKLRIIINEINNDNIDYFYNDNYIIDYLYDNNINIPMIYLYITMKNDKINNIEDKILPFTETIEL